MAQERYRVGLSLEAVETDPAPCDWDGCGAVGRWTFDVYANGRYLGAHDDITLCSDHFCEASKRLEGDE